MYKYKAKNILLNSFCNISELYNFCKNTPRKYGRSKSSENGSYDFTGSHSLEEAYDLLISGDDKLFQRFKSGTKIDIQKILGNVINKNKVKNDIVGFMPNIPNYLLSLPDSMLNTEPLKKSQKIINLVVSIGVSARTMAKEIEKAGMTYIKVLDLLEKCGYRCNLYALHSSICDSEYAYCLIKIKTDREPLNLKKMVFPLAHASMLRRVLFKWCESNDTDIDFTSGWNGYGRPNEDEHRIAKDLNKILKTNFIVWNYQKNGKNSVKSIINSLKEKGIGIDM